MLRFSETLVEHRPKTEYCHSPASECKKYLPFTNRTQLSQILIARAGAIDFHFKRRTATPSHVCEFSIATVLEDVQNSKQVPQAKKENLVAQVAANLLGYAPVRSSYGILTLRGMRWQTQWFTVHLES
eukprot:6178774-Pleurochrysis_carterae.AAC.1